MAAPLRSNTSLDPIYGISRPFTVADLPSSYNSGFVALTAATVDTTSQPIAHGGNGVEINPLFSDGVTTCSIDVAYAVGGALIKTFNNVSKFNASNLFIGYADTNILLGGQPITIRAYNFTGGGGVTVKVRRTS